MGLVVVRLWVILVGVTLLAPTGCRRRAPQAPLPATTEPTEVAVAWHCLFTRDVDVAQLQNGQQVRRLLESAHDGYKNAYPKHVLGCLPHLAQARKALGDARDPAVARYVATLDALERSVRSYSERLTRLEPMEELDEEIVGYAQSWYADDNRDHHAGYERFLTCAVPDLQKLPGDQALYDWLADRCFRHDPVPFMTRVRKDCGPLLEQQKPSPTLALNRDKFHRGAAQSWESCSDIALEQQRLAAARELVAASDAYLAARPRLSP